MKTVIVPIIKNKTGDTSDKNNYRPIALVTACSKNFELCILSIIKIYICIHDHQFGFKKQHATDMCIYTVKSVIKYYTRQNSPVYTCFLDASKASDRISHWTLFKKLIACNTPLLIVRILMFWYQRQSICVKWDQRTSECFSNDNDNDNDDECFILTYELIKQIIYSTMIDQYSHKQGNYIMTYISLACNYRNIFF